MRDEEKAEALHACIIPIIPNSRIILPKTSQKNLIGLYPQLGPIRRSIRMYLLALLHSLSWEQASRFSDDPLAQSERDKEQGIRDGPNRFHLLVRTWGNLEKKKKSPTDNIQREKYLLFFKST